MDSREQRAAHARWIASVLPELVEHGGDELVVIAEDIAGWLKGRREYGPLDLAADPRDLLQELADEERDSRNYLGALRVQARRRQAAEIEAREDEDDPAVPLPDGIDGAQLVAALEAARVAHEVDEHEVDEHEVDEHEVDEHEVDEHEVDEHEPNSAPGRRRTRRRSAGSFAELTSVLDEVAGGDGESGGALGR